MVEVAFYDHVNDELLEFAVIIAKAKGRWVLCRHRERETYEVPGGHREENETILETAKRELREETGAIDFTIQPICVYSVKEKAGEYRKSDDESFGMLFFAELYELEALCCEIEEILFAEQLDVPWTYPLIQPKLIEEAGKRGIV